MYMDQHLWLDCILHWYEIFQSHLITKLFDFVVFIMHGVFCLKFSQHYHGLWFFPPTLTIGDQNLSGKPPPPLPFDLIINMNTFIHSQGLHMSLEWAICFAHHPFCVTEIFLIAREHKFSLVHLFISNLKHIFN